MGGNRETGSRGETAGKEEKQRGPRGVWSRRGGVMGGRGIQGECRGSRGPHQLLSVRELLAVGPGAAEIQQEALRLLWGGGGARGDHRTALPHSAPLSPTAPHFPPSFHFPPFLLYFPPLPRYSPHLSPPHSHGAPFSLLLSAAPLGPDFLSRSRPFAASFPAAPQNWREIPSPRDPHRPIPRRPRLSALPLSFPTNGGARRALSPTPLPLAQ